MSWNAGAVKPVGYILSQKNIGKKPLQHDWNLNLRNVSRLFRHESLVAVTQWCLLRPLVQRFDLPGRHEQEDL